MLSIIMTQLEMPVLAFRGERFWAEIDRAGTASLWQGSSLRNTQELQSHSH